MPERRNGRWLPVTWKPDAYHRGGPECGFDADVYVANGGWIVRVEGPKLRTWVLEALSGKTATDDVLDFADRAVAYAALDLGKASREIRWEDATLDASTMPQFRAKPSEHVSALLFQQPDSLWHLLIEGPGDQRRRESFGRTLSPDDAKKAASMEAARYMKERTRVDLPTPEPVAIRVKAKGWSATFLACPSREPIATDLNAIEIAVRETAGSAIHNDPGTFADVLSARLGMDVKTIDTLEVDLAGGAR